ncbi:MAG TPA: S41 family peptidase [Pyrinomonadaceae bacterium]
MFAKHPRPFLRRHLLSAFSIFFLLALGCFSPAQAQLTKEDRERARIMLESAIDDIKKNYYDPSFRGIDLEARFKTAREKLDKATTNGQMFGVIAQLMLDLKDSHTFFLPPARAASVEYGWQMQMIGDKCFVVAVKPGSDAQAKGLKPGDLIQTVAGFSPSRENLWILQYLIYTLRPQPSLKVIVQSPGAEPREMEVMAKVGTVKKTIDVGIQGAMDYLDLIREAQNEARLNAHRYYEMGDDLFVWKMPQFDLTKLGVDEMMDKVRKRKALILDLRGNGGGAEETMLRLIGNLIDHDVKIGELKRRKETKPLVAKTRGDNIFKGQLIVLVDSRSGSAAELLSRVIQLEKRGLVIGDRTMGAVMRSRSYEHHIGTDVVVYYGTSITDADIIMSDGVSLEGAGVTPDELLLPTAEDMAAGKDPVLANAFSRVGIKIDAEKAGTLFPIRWK